MLDGEYTNGGDRHSMVRENLHRLCQTILMRQVGKRTRTDIYLHRSLVAKYCGFEIQQLDSLWFNHTQRPDLWNVLRVALDCRSVSLLIYPRFYDVGHPILDASLKVTIDRTDARLTVFQNRANRPILHRKELLVSESDEWFPIFKALSIEEEEWGLFAEARKIGYEKTWESVLIAAGVVIQGHRVVRAT